VREGKLSAYAAIDVFSGPEAYLPLLGQHPTTASGRPCLNRLDRPSNRPRPTSITGFICRINPQRRRDALRCLVALPGTYAHSGAGESRGVLLALRRNGIRGIRTERSPHHQHRQVLGWYEAAYNAGCPPLSRRPRGPVSVAAPAVAVGGAPRLASCARARRRPARARGHCWSSACSRSPTSPWPACCSASARWRRYRYLVEGMIWLITALAVARLARFFSTAGRVS